MQLKNNRNYFSSAKFLFTSSRIQLKPSNLVWFIKLSTHSKFQSSQRRSNQVFQFLLEHIIEPKKMQLVKLKMHPSLKKKARYICFIYLFIWFYFLFVWYLFLIWTYLLGVCWRFLPVYTEVIVALK